MGEALGMESIESLWAVYIELLDVYLNQPADTYVSQHGAKFEAVYTALEGLTPTELHSFLSSLNFLYDTSRGDTLVLDCSLRGYNTLGVLLTTYYREILPSNDLDAMFLDLLLAMENASLYGIKESAVKDLGEILV